METVDGPRPEPGPPGVPGLPPARPPIGWAAVAALALTGLVVLGAIWLRDERRAARPQPDPEELRLRLDLNTASADELRLLPGIGPTYAERIVQVRLQRGPFRKLSELDDPRLLGPGASERLAGYLRPLPEPR